MDVLAAAITTARNSGLTVDEAVVLRSTNNLLVWLRPTEVVAKIAPDANRRLGEELMWATRLTELGAPIVPPADLLGASVHRVLDREMTFWRYAPQGEDPPPASDAIAVALFQLHRALRGCDPPRRAVTDDLEATVELLNDWTFAAEMSKHDRRLLQSAMSTPLVWPTAPDTVVHGSPHHFNILSIDGQVRFIDFETVAYGPVEWDLAHLEPAVAAAYAGAVDQALLARCRIAISALTSAHCWHGRHRGRDMVDHARHHLDVLRPSAAANDINEVVWTKRATLLP